MQLDVIDIQGKKVGQIEVSDAVFAAPVREDLFWEVVKAQRAARRAGTHKTKKMGEVRGGGKKPYRQKGTGNARQGSIRAPHFVGGGTVFGPQPRSYAYTVPKKVRRAALASAISLRAKQNKILVLERLDVAEPKTKVAAGVLKRIGAESALVVDGRVNANLIKSLRNLPGAKCLAPEGLNVYDILNHSTLVITKDVVKAIEGRVTDTARSAA
jgi:large subunit ribosomal protein L4